MAFHITDDGKIRQCYATKRPCPFRHEHPHFEEIGEAEAYYEENLGSKYGLLGGKNWAEENKKYDKHKDSYFHKIKSIKLIEGFSPNEEIVSKHYKNTRKKRAQTLSEELGEGKAVMTYLVDDGRKKAQIQQISDKGILSVYDKDTKKLVTQYALRKPRLEAICDKLEIEVDPDLEKVVAQNTKNKLNNA